MEEETSCIVDSLQLLRDSKYSHGYGSLDSPSCSFEHSDNNKISIITLDDFDQFPVYASCPKCHKKVLTHLEYKSGLLTILLCALLCIMCCFWGCCLIPLLVKSCKDVYHMCPDCNTHIGTYKRI